MSKLINKCPVCGEPNGLGSTSCKACGYSLSRRQEESEPFEHEHGEVREDSVDDIDDIDEEDLDFEDTEDTSSVHQEEANNYNMSRQINNKPMTAVRTDDIMGKLIGLIVLSFFGNLILFTIIFTVSWLSMRKNGKSTEKTESTFRLVYKILIVLCVLNLLFNLVFGLIPLLGSLGNLRGF